MYSVVEGEAYAERKLNCRSSTKGLSGRGIAVEKTAAADAAGGITFSVFTSTSYSNNHSLYYFIRDCKRVLCVCVCTIDNFEN